MKLTKERIDKASKIAEARMEEALKTMSGIRLNDYRRLGNIKIFTPSKGGKK